MTPPHSPDKPTQQQLRPARSQQLWALRHLKTGHKDAKHLLCRLDDHIGDGRQGFTWRITVDELADECEMSESTARKWLRFLDSEGFIRWRGKQGQTPEFTICWNRIFAAADEQQQTARAAVQTAPAADRSAAGEFQTARAALQSAPAAVSYILNKRPLSAQIAPPSPDTREAAVAEISEKLKAGGINAVPTAIRKALELRSLDELAAIVAHFAEQFLLPDGPTAFHPGFLFWRITDPDSAALAPHEGWKEPSPAFKARKAAQAKPEPRTCDSGQLARVPADRQARVQYLERKHAARFDGLNREQLLQLASRAPGREAGILAQAVRSGLARASRPMFLEILEAEEKPP